MNQKIVTHTLKYPHARTSTIRYLVQREEKTQQLMKEIHEDQLRRAPNPWWQRLRPSWVWRW